MRKMTIVEVNQFINDYDNWVKDQNKKFGSLDQMFKVMALAKAISGLKVIRDGHIADGTIDKFIEEEQDMLRRTAWCVYEALGETEKRDEIMSQEEVEEDHKIVEKELNERGIDSEKREEALIKAAFGNDGVTTEKTEAVEKAEAVEAAHKKNRAFLESLDSLKGVKKDLTALSIIVPRIGIAENKITGDVQLIINPGQNKLTRKEFDKIRHLFNSVCNGNCDDCDGDKED